MRILVLSNGHGEDVIGSRLARHLQAEAPGLEITAHPLVGTGRAYRDAGITVQGPVRTLPAGGLTFHTAANFLADLRAGLLQLTFRQLRFLRWSDRPDAVIVVGDVWALALSLLSGLPPERRFALQTLVSVRQATGPRPRFNRLLMERITPLEAWLQRRFTGRVWLRDAQTASALRSRGVSQAAYAGSLLFDEAPVRASEDSRQVLLLPGSRQSASESLARMLPLTRELTDVTWKVAWAGAELPEPAGWQLVPGEPAVLKQGNSTVELHRNAFEALLPQASLVVGTAGTALEMAAAAGLPVVTFALGEGHSAAFVANQQRLLAGALSVADSADVSVLAPLVDRLLTDSEARAKVARAGAEILGEPGGLPRIARETARLLSDG